MELRISKYAPQCRRVDGTYDRNEWTSYSDIGKEFVDGVLTAESYMQTEAMFVEAILSFFRAACVPSLFVEEVEVVCSAGEPGLSLVDISVGSEIDLESLAKVVELCLREKVWVKLRGENQAYVHFGYDFYVYIGADHYGANSWHPPPGVFAEVFSSPYKD